MEAQDLGATDIGRASVERVGGSRPRDAGLEVLRNALPARRVGTI
jgi:hypothetical protein